MRLSVFERVLLFNILPEKGTFATMRAVHDLRMALGLTEGERVQIGYEELENGSRWDRELEVEIPVSVDGFRAGKEALETLDKKGEITADHLSLYEKFVNDAQLRVVNE